MSIRADAKLLKKMRIPDRSVIAVVDNTEGYTIAERISRALAETPAKDVIVVAVANRDDIAVFDEKEMNEHGWYRIEALKKKILVHSGKKEGEDVGQQESS